MTLEEANKKVNLISSCLNVEYGGELVICNSWVLEEEFLWDIVDSLKWLIETEGKYMVGKDWGVCEEIGIPIPEQYLIDWEYYSGDVDYPVDDKDSGLSPEEQLNSLSLWEGKQLELRLDLCKHVLPIFKGVLDTMIKEV